MKRACALVSSIVCGTAVWSQGAIVTFDIAPAAGGKTVTVLPGAQVDYILYVLVQSETSTPDNQGLESLQLDIDTGSGVTQQPLDSFADVIVQNFPLFQSLGVAEADKITAITASQNLLTGTAFTGVGVGGYQEIGRGKFNTPTTETAFTPKVNSGASGHVVSTAGTAAAATTNVGAGFTIITSNSASGGGGETTPGMSPTAVALVSLVAVLFVLFAAFSMGGSMGLAIGLVVGPLLGSLLLLML